MSAPAITFLRHKTSRIKYAAINGDYTGALPVSTLSQHPELSTVAVQCETCETIHPARLMRAIATGLQCLACNLKANAPKVSARLIDDLKDQGQDFEFYPTTTEILEACIKDLSRLDDETPRWMRRQRNTHSVLDIGAGNGKALAAFKAADFTDLYAIEKSELLRAQLPAEVYIVGTDFAEQSLISKVVDVIFCNPPYSCFEDWTVKIIRQAAASTVYLVIPQRWKDSTPIADALKFRDASTATVGSFDFANAEDRTARAKVDLIRITFETSAFACAFDEQFSFKRTDKAKTKEAAPERKQDKFASLVIGESYPEAIVALYLEEMARIERNYKLAAELDPDLMRELDVTPSKIMDCLGERLKNLRTLYWSELFGRMAPITDRLTAKSRAQVLDRLQKHVQVDFTVGNIHAVILWVIKNANTYLDKQLVETYGHMIDKANVILYKSNHKPFVQDRWRYREDAEENTHFALDYRIVMHSCGGLSTGWNSYKAERFNNLEERAHDFLCDLLTIANNLGFNTGSGRPLHLSMNGPQWQTNQPHTFVYFPKGKAKPEVLFEARAFKNQNLHIRLAKKFALALNVEHGRLKGWLRSGEQASEELRDPAAAPLFRSNLQLPMIDPLLQLVG